MYYYGVIRAKDKHRPYFLDLQNVNSSFLRNLGEKGSLYEITTYKLVLGFLPGLASSLRFPHLFKWDANFKTSCFGDR